MIESVALFVTLASVAEILTEALFRVGEVRIVKLPLVTPAATRTLGGTEASENFLLPGVTVAPFVGPAP